MFKESNLSNVYNYKSEISTVRKTVIFSWLRSQIVSFLNVFNECQFGVC